MVSKWGWSCVLRFSRQNGFFQQNRLNRSWNSYSEIFLRTCRNQKPPMSASHHPLSNIAFACCFPWDHFLHGCGVRTDESHIYPSLNGHQSFLFQGTNV